MKKYVIILIFFLVLILLFNIKDDSKMVMSNIENQNEYYELDFTNESLNFRNFKLKFASFTSYEFKITKVYIDYSNNIKEYFDNKEYFSFNSNTLNGGIEKLKEEYNVVLKDNYLYDELDKDVNEIIIKKVEIYTTKDALIIFKNKYPGVIINRIQ